MTLPGKELQALQMRGIFKKESMIMKANFNKRPTELQDLPEHTHQAGSVQHDKEDHATPSEQSRRGKEHSNKSFLESLAADRASATGRPGFRTPPRRKK